MLLPRRLLAIRLKRRNCWKHVPKYFRLLTKRENNMQRINFIVKCRAADITPRFLRFRIPDNGCFEPTVVHNFQRKLLNQELKKARDLLTVHNKSIERVRKEVRESVPSIYIPSIVFNVRHIIRTTRSTIHQRHQQKLSALSAEQQRPSSTCMTLKYRV
jgi:hypothetical protein